MEKIGVRFFLVVSILLSQSASANEFSYADLKQLVAEKDLRSVEQVLPHLPQEYKDSFTLMHSSRSIQRSRHEAPRAIMFGNTGKLVLGFNGHKDDAGHDRLEVIQFNDKTDKFEFGFIYFADLDTKAEVIDNPMNCIGCHGRIANDLHPDWDVGLIWRGAYGSQDDTFASTQLDPELHIEAQEYTKFLGTTATHERYKHLNFTTPLDQGPKTVLENRPNLRLGLLMTRLQIKRIARQIEQAKGFEPLRYTIVSQLLGCQSVQVDPVFRADIEAKMNAFLRPIYGDKLTDEFLRDQAPGSLDAFTIGKALGIDLLEWPITAEKRTYAVFDGSFTFKELLATEMFSRLAKKEARFAPFVEALGLSESPLRLARTPASEAADSLGGKLSPKALAACPLL